MISSRHSSDPHTGTGLYPAYYAAAAGDPPESMQPIGIVPARDDEVELHELEPHFEEDHPALPVEQLDHETVELHELDHFEPEAPAPPPSAAAEPVAVPAASIPMPAHDQHHHKHHKHHGHHGGHHHAHQKTQVPEKATTQASSQAVAATGLVGRGAPQTDEYRDIEAPSQSPPVYEAPKSTSTITVNPNPAAGGLYGKETPRRSSYASHKSEGPNANLHIALSCFTIWCCGCLCGLIAFVFALQVKEKVEHGEMRGAKKYATYSKVFMILSVVTFGIVLVVYFTMPA